MAIALPDLDNLDATQVAQNLTNLSEQLQEKAPSLDTRLGALRDIILYSAALLATQRAQQLADYQNVRSLAQLVADPELGDAEAVDDVLSNFQLTRQQGSESTGNVTVVVSATTTVILGQGAVFTANGRTFTSTQTITAKSQLSQVIASGDRYLQPLPNGNYAFAVPVSDSAVGLAGNLAGNTVLTLASPPPAFVVAYAAAAFTGGVDTETNTALVGRLMQGAAAQTISNRATMLAWLRAQPAYANFVTASVIGFGDVEMLRDRHWLWPIGGGGRVDWYVRTVAQVATVLLPSVSATLVQKTLDGFGIWQFSINRNAAPGFYDVLSIVPAGAGNVTSFSVTRDVRAIDLTPPAAEYLVPDIVDVIEGAYTRFQAAIIQFEDTNTLTGGLTLGAVRTYDVTVRGLPLLAGLQDLISGRNNASYGCDTLVRAPIPCFVTLSFTLYQPSTAVAPDPVALATALCAVVNATDFVGQLFASSLAAAIHGGVAAGVTVSAINMTGNLRCPDGTIVVLSSTEVLTVLAEPTLTVTGRTVQFFLTPADITINVVTA